LSAKKFLRFESPLFALFVTNHVAGHSITDSALAYHATELRLASSITVLSETADAASYWSVCNPSCLDHYSPCHVPICNTLFITNMAELHLSGLIGTASHPICRKSW
jgi:hypothetical protein